MIESLESRRLLAGVTPQIIDGVLTINCTDAEEELYSHVWMNPDNVGWRITIGDTINPADEFFYLTGEFNAININLLGGHDLADFRNMDVPMTVRGGSGNDYVFTGLGDDFIRGNSGRDRLYGMDGNDFVHGDNGKDMLYGWTGDDHLYGGGEDDTIKGDIGDDTIRGDIGVEEIRGNDGDDRLIGGASTDNIRGGSGNDRFFVDEYREPGPHNWYDYLHGDSGRDFARYYEDNPCWLTEIEVTQVMPAPQSSLALLAAAAPEPEIIDDRLQITGTDDADTIEVRRVDTIFPYVVVTVNGEESRFDESVDWQLIRIDALDGDDTIDASGVIQRLYVSAGRGNDTVTGGDRDSVLKGGPGRDTLRQGAQGWGALHGGNGNDRLFGVDYVPNRFPVAGNDLLHGGSGNDVLIGGTGDDTLRGGDGDDLLRGQRGDDRLVGGAGIDRIRGADGNDRIFADDGDIDDLNGGENDDFARADDEDVSILIEEIATL